MRHVLKPRCRHDCRFLQITENLWLCPHASYGPASYQRGAVEEARRMLARAGGYDEVLHRLEAAEADKAKERQEERDKKRNRLMESLRYDV